MTIIGLHDATGTWEGRNSEGVATIVERENIVDNLATAILDLYNHPEKRKNMAKISLERSRLFDKETYAKNFFKALEGI